MGLCGISYKNKKLCVLSVVKPVILVNQFLGVCPHEISGDILVFRKSSFKFIKTLFTILILLIQFMYTTVQFSRSLISGQSMLKLGFLFGAMTAPGISLLILAVTLQKRHQFTHFFLKCEEFKSSVCMKGINNCPRVISVAWRFYAFYMLLAIGQALLVAYDTFQRPTSQVYFLYYVHDPSPVLIALNSLYQFYLVIITQSACALVEVFCAAISCQIVNTTGKIRNSMKEVVEQENTTTNDQSECQGNGAVYQKIVNEVKVQMDTENKENPGAYGIPYYPSPAILKDGAAVEEKYSTEPIMIAIKRYSYMSQKQGLINCIFGPILALDIAWLVIHVCLLFFLQIKSLSLISNQKYLPNNNQTEVVDAEFFENTSNRICFFAGQGLIYLVRLMIVLISLGNVHEHTRWLDAEITSNLMKVKKPRASDLQLITVHLLGSQSNPVAFSAGGFFIFSRNTILYVFSIVTTYVIFMLQA